MLPARVMPCLKPLQSGLTALTWKSPPRNIFVAKKDLNVEVLEATQTFLEHLHNSYDVNLLAQSSTVKELDLPYVTDVTAKALKESVDLVVTLGGDGTMLRAALLFRDQIKVMPPFLSFSMGTLGFLMPFKYENAASTFRQVYEGRANVIQRQRLSVDIPGTTSEMHAMNDVTIHRGDSPHLAQLDITINGYHVTTAVADGVTISTPTGSTAYSLSAGGSIVHPAVRCLLLTPICPQSLSFRPLVLPQNAEITVSVAPAARGPSYISVDGLSGGQLGPNEKLCVKMSSDEGVWCVSHGSSTEDWVHHLNGLLGFNAKFGSPV